MTTSYIRFDEREDAIAALELLAAIAPDLKKKPSLWKWMVIGAQNSLQATMVLAVSGTDGCGALNTKSQKQFRSWLSTLQGPEPEAFMADYNTLLARVGDADLMEGPPLKVSVESLNRLKELNKLRRQFAHYNPLRWSIERLHVLQIVPTTLDAVEYLFSTQPRVQVHLTKSQKRRIASSLRTTRAALAGFNRRRRR